MTYEWEISKKMFLSKCVLESFFIDFKEKRIHVLVSLRDEEGNIRQYADFDIQDDEKEKTYTELMSNLNQGLLRAVSYIRIHVSRILEKHEKRKAEKEKDGDYC